MPSPEAKSSGFERTSEFVRKLWWKECLIQFCVGRSLALRYIETNKPIRTWCALEIEILRTVQKIKVSFRKCTIMWISFDSIFKMKSQFFNGFQRHSDRIINDAKQFYTQNHLTQESLLFKSVGSIYKSLVVHQVLDLWVQH